jgi:hypothetical protein
VTQHGRTRLRPHRNSGPAFRRIRVRYPGPPSTADRTSSVPRYRETSVIRSAKPERPGLCPVRRKSPLPPRRWSFSHRPRWYYRRAITRTARRRAAGTEVRNRLQGIEPRENPRCQPSGVIPTAGADPLLGFHLLRVLSPPDTAVPLHGPPLTHLASRTPKRPRRLCPRVSVHRRIGLPLSRLPTLARFSSSSSRSHEPNGSGSLRSKRDRCAGVSEGLYLRAIRPPDRRATHRGIRFPREAAPWPVATPAGFDRGCGLRMFLRRPGDLGSSLPLHTAREGRGPAARLAARALRHVPLDRAWRPSTRPRRPEGLRHETDAECRRRT